MHRCAAAAPPSLSATARCTRQPEGGGGTNMPRTTTGAHGVVRPSAALFVFSGRATPSSSSSALRLVFLLLAATASLPHTNAADGGWNYGGTNDPAKYASSAGRQAPWFKVRFCSQGPQPAAQLGAPHSGDSGSLRQLFFRRNRQPFADGLNDPVAGPLGQQGTNNV